jgi:hypothetical protein
MPHDRGGQTVPGRHSEEDRAAEVVSVGILEVIVGGSGWGVD